MKIIVCKGGLGNQMFQYAFYVMLRHYHHCKFDYSLFNFVKIHNGFELPRVFDLSPLEDKFCTLNIQMIRAFHKLNYYPVFKDKNQYVSNVEKEKAFVFIGDWQSEKWFSQFKEEVLKSFSFKNIMKRNLQESRVMQSCNSVSVHIRRGDYVGNRLYENCATLDYYKKALAYIRQQSPDCKIWIFSNEIPWCKEYLSEFIDNSTSFVDWNMGMNSYQDMFLMSQCKYNIIANSSFSWWGAYLNRNESKIVVAPAKWFNTQNIELYKDIVPETWVRF